MCGVRLPLTTWCSSIISLQAAHLIKFLRHFSHEFRVLLLSKRLSTHRACVEKENSVDAQCACAFNVSNLTWHLSTVLSCTFATRALDKEVDQFQKCNVPTLFVSLNPIIGNWLRGETMLDWHKEMSDLSKSLLIVQVYPPVRHFPLLHRLKLGHIFPFVPLIVAVAPPCGPSFSFVSKCHPAVFGCLFSSKFAND